MCYKTKGQIIVIVITMSSSHLSFLLELQVFPVEPEGGDSILSGVVGDSLDPRVQEMPGQKLQRHPPWLQK